MTAPCKCPSPELCAALKRHENGRPAISGRLWEIWTGQFSNRSLSPQECEKFRQKWLADAGLTQLPPSIGPSIVHRASNYVKAVSVDVANGCERLSQAEYDRRLAVCNGCSLLRADRICADMRCGCPVDKKAWWESQDCPQNRWPALPQFRVGNTTRHLAYYVYPLKHPETGGESWRWNVAQLLKRIKLFNGHKIICVAWGPQTETPAEVRGLFETLSRNNGGGGERDFTFIHIINRPGRREGFGLEQMLPRLKEASDGHNEGHFTFFAHTKGATKNFNTDPVIKWWAEWMYERCLDVDADEFNDHMTRHPITGCFKKHGAFHFPKNHAWHYSGAFYWIRNKDLFEREWSDVDTHFCGYESYPGRLFTWAEAGSLWHEGGMEMNLYAPEYWQPHVIPNLPQHARERILPELEEWKNRKGLQF